MNEGRDSKAYLSEDCWERTRKLANQRARWDKGQNTGLDKEGALGALLDNTPCFKGPRGELVLGFGGAGRCGNPPGKLSTRGTG